MKSHTQKITDFSSLREAAESESATPPSTQEAPARPSLPIRMLYVVGGGPGMADRVDVSDLFARQLAGQGFEIDWVMDDSQAGPTWRETTWLGARAYTVGRSKKGGLAGSIANKIRGFSGDVRTSLLILKNEYDIVQVRDKFIVAVLAKIVARLRGAKFTYWASYPFAENHFEDARTGRAKFPPLSVVFGKGTSWVLYRIILPGADHIFVQSRQMLTDFAAQGIAREAMTPVPMGIGEHLLEHPRCVVEPRTALYLGTLNLVRRLDTLINAIAIVRKRFPDARLIFVGDGDVPDDRLRLERAMEAHGLKDAVEITGWLPAAEAHERVCKAAVCISPFYPIPILLSTSPTKLIEYMALQRPVVASEHPEQSVIIEESGAGICVPWSAEHFAKAIETLFENPDEAEAMAQRGRKYIKTKRLYPLIAKEVASEYFKLVSERREKLR